MCFQPFQQLAESPQRILILVADNDLREAARYWIEAIGVRVDEARHGSNAAELLEAAPYRALVTDRFVPPWPGLGSIPRLKRLYPSVRLVVLLRRGPIGTASLLRVAGADAVIETPIRQAALLRALLSGPAGQSRG